MENKSDIKVDSEKLRDVDMKSRRIEASWSLSMSFDILQRQMMSNLLSANQPKKQLSRNGFRKNKSHRAKNGGNYKKRIKRKR